MSMTPEEIVNIQTWKILQNIKEEYFVVGKNKLVKYKIGSVDIIPRDRKVDILKNLYEWRALNIVTKHSKSESYGLEFEWENATEFELEINQPKFDEIYKKFQKACDLEAYLNNYQESMFEKLKDGKTESVLPKFLSLENNLQTETEQWLTDKSERFLRRIWRVVRALNYEWELKDQDSFPIPHDKFGMYKITNANDLESILTNLHRKKFIFISRKVGETPPSNDPNKPKGSLWEPITDNPKMIHQSTTKLEVLPQKFKLLVQILKGTIAQIEAQPSDTPVEKTPTAQIQPKDPQILESEQVSVIKTDNKLTGWELAKDDTKAYLKKENSIVFTFPTNWSRRFKYFEYLWNHQNQKISYKEAYEHATALKYLDQKGVIWKTNKGIRNEINKLRKALESSSLPIKIETARGLTLTITK